MYNWAQEIEPAFSVRSGTCLMSQAEHGCSWIPGEGARGFPGEDEEAALKGFMFLFRPPGLATAADGDRLGPQMPSVLDYPVRSENTHPKGTCPTPVAAVYME